MIFIVLHIQEYIATLFYKINLLDQNLIQKNI